jgi:hypothetical protein
MTIELNRRTFLTLIGATAATAALARSTRSSGLAQTAPTGMPRCFLHGQNLQIPAQPKSVAITYLSE